MNSRRNTALELSSPRDNRQPPFLRALSHWNLTQSWIEHRRSLPPNPATSTVTAAPQQEEFTAPMSRLDAIAIASWIRAGGHLIVLGSSSCAHRLTSTVAGSAIGDMVRCATHASGRQPHFDKLTAEGGVEIALVPFKQATCLQRPPSSTEPHDHLLLPVGTAGAAAETTFIAIDAQCGLGHVLFVPAGFRAYSAPSEPAHEVPRLTPSPSLSLGPRRRRLLEDQAALAPIIAVPLIVCVIIIVGILFLHRWRFVFCCRYGCCTAEYHRQYTIYTMRTQVNMLELHGNADQARLQHLKSAVEHLEAVAELEDQSASSCNFRSGPNPMARAPGSTEPARSPRRSAERNSNRSIDSHAVTVASTRSGRQGSHRSRQGSSRSHSHQGSYRSQLDNLDDVGSDTSSDHSSRAGSVRSDHIPDYGRSCHSSRRGSRGLHHSAYAAPGAPGSRSASVCSAHTPELPDGNHSSRRGSLHSDGIPFSRGSRHSSVLAAHTPELTHSTHSSRRGSFHSEYGIPTGSDSRCGSVHSDRVQPANHSSHSSRRGSFHSEYGGPIALGVRRDSVHSPAILDSVVTVRNPDSASDGEVCPYTRSTPPLPFIGPPMSFPAPLPPEPVMHVPAASFGRVPIRAPRSSLGGVVVNSASDTDEDEVPFRNTRSSSDSSRATVQVPA